jgi:hypothetical protein
MTTAFAAGGFQGCEVTTPTTSQTSTHTTSATSTRTTTATTSTALTSTVATTPFEPDVACVAKHGTSFFGKGAKCDANARHLNT